MQSELLGFQRSAGNAAVARLLSGGHSPANLGQTVVQRRTPSSFDVNKLNEGKRRLVELEAEKELVADALEIKNKYNDPLKYLHDMDVSDATEALAKANAFFAEATQLGRHGTTSKKSLDAFVKKVNAYDKSGGKNAIQNAIVDLDKKLVSRQRDQLTQITKLDEAYFTRYLALPRPPKTAYRGNGIGVNANSLDNFVFKDVPAGGTRDVSMFGVVQHTHTNTFKNGMVSCTAGQDLALGYATDTHTYGIVFELRLDDYVDVAYLLKQRNFRNRFPGQLEILATGPVPARNVVSATLYHKATATQPAVAVGTVLNPAAS